MIYDYNSICISNTYTALFLYFYIYTFVSISISLYLYNYSGNKRRTMIERAKHYDLGGFSKHGHPGVCIVEGELSNVLGFVRDIQQLRWKQMVVRGEDIQELDNCVDIDTNFVPGSNQTQLQTELINISRKLPHEYIELQSMSEAGALCQASGLHDLFMTSMKKYES